MNGESYPLTQQRFIYATQLPTGYVKVGVASSVSRAKAASTYHVGDVRVLGFWWVPVGRSAEDIERWVHQFLWWCHIVRELFDGSSRELLCDCIGYVTGAPRLEEGELSGVSCSSSREPGLPYRNDWTPEMRARAVELVRAKHAARRASRPRNRPA